MKDKIIRKIKIYSTITIVILIGVFAYLFRGYLPFYNKTFLNVEEVKQRAIEAAGGGEVIFINPDFFGIFPHYEVSVRNDYLVYNVEIYAKSGLVKSFEMEN